MRLVAAALAAAALASVSGASAAPRSADSRAACISGALFRGAFYTERSDANGTTAGRIGRADVAPCGGPPQLVPAYAVAGVPPTAAIALAGHRILVAPHACEGYAGASLDDCLRRPLVFRGVRYVALSLEKSLRTGRRLGTARLRSRTRAVVALGAVEPRVAVAVRDGPRRELFLAEDRCRSDRETLLYCLGPGRTPDALKRLRVRAAGRTVDLRALPAREGPRLRVRGGGELRFRTSFAAREVRVVLAGRVAPGRVQGVKALPRGGSRTSWRLQLPRTLPTVSAFDVYVRYNRRVAYLGGQEYRTWARFGLPLAGPVADAVRARGRPRPGELRLELEAPSGEVQARLVQSCDAELGRRALCGDPAPAFTPVVHGRGFARLRFGGRPQRVEAWSRTFGGDTVEIGGVATYPLNRRAGLWSVRLGPAEPRTSLCVRARYDAGRSAVFCVGLG